MTLKPLIALTVISVNLTPGVKGDPKKGIEAVPPTSRTILPFKKTGLAFMAKDEDQQAEMLNLECAVIAPSGTPLDPEAVVAGAAPVRKAAAAPSKPKPAAKPAAKPAETKTAEPADNGKSDDGTGMV